MVDAAVIHFKTEMMKKHLCHFISGGAWIKVTSCIKYDE